MALNYSGFSLKVMAGAKPAISQFACKKAMRFRLIDLIDYGLEPALHAHGVKVIHKQISVRLAHQFELLSSFPGSRPVDNLLALQINSFEELQSMTKVVNMIQPSKDGNRKCVHKAAITKTLSNIGDRVASSLETVVEAIPHFHQYLLSKEGHEMASQGVTASAVVDEYIQRMIGITTLTEHVRTLHKWQKRGREGSDQRRVGVVAVNFPIRQVVEESIEHALHLTERALLHSCEVHILGDASIKGTFIYSHLSHILLEMLKNSVKASCEVAGTQDCMPFPVTVLVSEGADDICIRISDQGGGMSRANLKSCKEYIPAAQKQGWHPLLVDQQSYQPTSCPLAGMGVGIPVSALYAQHFGGNIRLCSMDGYGTDVYVFIPKASQMEHFVTKE
eukprot:CAMPEP_0113942428 /NCGR_PEP_ID=MMETSP1339-20121228/8139_1 /TAXON_ID=94617 /ORGANISM="Fibrocapsa japonica" /LENGTH=390 /DNA_ID=CAMNT_0000946897 /DNA_START=70 /DNA_END=1242 /DNA_ORIENTATION=- /assembly_acc=CAM_ASM_000762